MIEGRHVSLAHGNGGRFMRELIEEVFVRHLANPALDTLSDAAHVSLPAGEVLVTTVKWAAVLSTRADPGCLWRGRARA